jgi:hypothetical protein
MQSHGERRTSPRARSLRPHPLRAEELEALRRELIGPEQTRLDVLEETAPTAESLGALIPAAIAHASHATGDELAVALAEPVTRSLRDVARREPELFGEILAPAIGTAVRRAVTDAFAALLQRINQLVEQGLSYRSIRWRIEAKRTGRTYSEVVLERTLVYRVEWAVLLHSETSLVIDQVTSLDAVAHAPDQTSAMLQAINAFVSDALQSASPGAAVQTIEVGDLNLWIERDPHYTLAIAIRGASPLALRDRIRKTLEEVRVLHPEPHAVVDIEQFTDTRPLLTDLLEQRRVTPPKRAPWILGFAGLLALVVVAVFWVRANARHHHEARTMLAFERLLDSTPGYALTSVEHHDGGYRVRGLRDPRALPAAMLVTSAGLPLPTFELTPFVSSDPRLVSPLAVVDATIRALEQITFAFPLDNSLDLDEQQIHRSAEVIERARRASAAANATLCVQVVGDSDPVGTERRNAQLRVERAAAVVHALERAGVPTHLLAPMTADPARPGPHARGVTFRAFLRPSTHQGECR